MIFLKAKIIVFTHAHWLMMITTIFNLHLFRNIEITITIFTLQMQIHNDFLFQFGRCRHYRRSNRGRSKNINKEESYL